MYFGYVVHKDGKVVAHGGLYDEADKVLAVGHGDYTGWVLTRAPTHGNQPFKDVRVGDIVELSWRPTCVPPAPPGTVSILWDNKTVTVKEVTSEDAVLVSELQSFPPTAKVAYKVTRHVENDPPTTEEIELAVSKAQADGALLYRSESPIIKELYEVRNGQLFDLRTGKTAIGVEYGFEGKKGLVSRVWARVFGGG